MNAHLIPITYDLYDIACRLKSVNEGYKVYYNSDLCRYEVYDRDNFAFVVPFGELDARTIDYARKTAVCNADKIFAEIERDNDRVTAQILSDAAENAAYKLNTRRTYDS